MKNFYRLLLFVWLSCFLMGSAVGQECPDSGASASLGDYTVGVSIDFTVDCACNADNNCAGAGISAAIYAACTTCPPPHQMNFTANGEGTSYFDAYGYTISVARTAISNGYHVFALVTHNGSAVNSYSSDITCSGSCPPPPCPNPCNPDCPDFDLCVCDPCSCVTCDDGDGCTANICVDGVCSYPSLCDDGDLCTTDACENGNCTHTLMNCDDGNLCTTDACVDGVCSNIAMNCDDQNPCTTDACVDGVCFNIPMNCDDQNLCTIDACVDGVCFNIPMNCDDQNPCTTDACIDGVCFNIPMDCDDQNPCTDDYCENGVCYHLPNTTTTVNFSDSTTCDGNAYFTDLSAGFSSQNWYWDFGDGSTSTDQNPAHYFSNSGNFNVCLTVSGYDACGNWVSNQSFCQNVSISTSCDDGNPCTIDACTNGVCANEPINCDDGDPCTTDFCDENGNCQHVYPPTPTTNFTFSTACYGNISFFGQAEGFSNIQSWAWNFGDGSTANEQNPTHTYNYSGNFTATLTVSGYDGCSLWYVIESSQTISVSTNCDDGNPCTIDYCDAAGCHNDYINCDDGNPCTYDYCDTNGNCQHDPISCNDYNDCTNDYCDENGVCHNDPNYGASFTNSSLDDCGNASFSNSSWGLSNINYSWNFGDGNTGAGENPSHVFASSGTYSVCLSVNAYNNCGQYFTTEICQTITVTVIPSPASATISPSGAAICSGDNLTFTCTADGATFFQWKNNGVDIPGETNSTFTATTAGTFSCTASNICGSAISNEEAVTITNPPASATITAGGATNICLGSNVNLACAAPNATDFQWKKDGNNISGATAANYLANQTGVFTCTASNFCGSATSNAIAVTVTNPISGATITASGATTFCQNGSVNLTCDAANAITFQWKKNGANIPGATNPTFSANETGSFTCEASNICGAVVSNAISVTVNQPPAAPIISANGSSILCTGSVLLTCTSAGATAFQWKKNGTNIAGATNATFSATATLGTATYTCAVSNICGNATAPGFYIHVGKPTAVSIAADGPTTICNGDSLTLTCTATAATSFQWKRGAVIVQTSASNIYEAKIAGSYTCTAINACGSTVSTAIVVTVRTAVIAAATATTFCLGGNVKLTCTAAGATAFQWKKDGTPIPGATTAIFTATQSGIYTCTAQFPCGSLTSNPIAVTVNTPPATPIISPSGTVNICSGSTVLTCTAAGATSFQWKKNAVNIAGATSSSYPANSTGTFTCYVANTCGNATTTPGTKVHLGNPTAVSIAAGGATTFCQGDSTTLTCTATGATSFQWKKGGIDIPGATASIFKAKIAGSYTCAAVNACGNTVSTNTISVNVFQPIASAVVTSNFQSFCTALILTCTAPNAATFQWQKLGTTWANIAGATAQNYTATAVGSYRCTATNVCGSMTSAPLVIAAASVALTRTGTICNGTSFLTATLTNCVAAPTNAFKWYKGTALVATTSVPTYILPAAGAGSYKVVVTLDAGCTRTSPVLAVTCAAGKPTGGSDKIISERNILENENFRLAPNPFGEVLKLTTEHISEQDFSVQIFDLTGKLFSEKTWPSGTQSIGFQSNEWQMGVYFIQIKNQSGEHIQTLRAVKME